MRGPLHAIHAWGLPLMVGVLLVSLWVLIVVVSTTQRQRLIEDSQRELIQLNNAVSQHAAGLFRKVESDLRIMERWLQANPDVDLRSAPHFVAMVDDLRESTRGLTDLRLLATDGRSYAIPTRPGTTPLDVSIRPFYQQFMSSSEQGLFIGEAVLSREVKRWRIPTLWRLQTPVRDIQAVFAGIDLNRLGALHEQMRLQPNGSILLVRSDGIVLSRTPYVQEVIGRDLSKGRGFATEYGVKPRGAYISEAGIGDGMQRLTSYQRLDDYPLIVLVNRPLDDVLAVYNVRRDIVFGAAAVLTLLALAFTWVLWRSQHALRTVQQNLQRLEATDSLTGVMSRRAFLDAAQREFARARRYARPTAVLIFDLDHFKRINDSHGHAVGDTVLRECAAAWKTVLREQDLLGRIGGEEFCAVLPETPKAAAAQAAERLRKAVLPLRFHGRDRVFSVSVSVGMTMLARGDEELAQAMERADRAMYLAKERGRDCVECIEEPHLTVVGGTPGHDAIRRNPKQ
jgi:diguanylate cyclase (GGDEF)-like protein